MIYGIGTDIVSIKRIRDSISRNPVKFPQRILTPFEMEKYRDHYEHSLDNASAYLAKRFAAKEATAKAFGIGFSQGLSLQHIETFNNDLGQPHLRFYEFAQEFINQKQIKQSHLSLSDEKEFAIAYVILSI
ncbi:MAG: holo-ACP synthase [Gammaproteobacteria bacterium]|nr:holo-ACP synthase [Gammaproteobacteria bacterium]